MKIIDLLNKIANGEELPEIIKVMGANYYLCNGDQSGCYYFSEKQGFGGVRLSFDTSVMNEEVEIIGDNKIEKIDQNDREWHYLHNTKKTTKEVADNLEHLRQKVNQIIDYLEEKE